MMCDYYVTVLTQKRLVGASTRVFEHELVGASTLGTFGSTLPLFDLHLMSDYFMVRWRNNTRFLN